MKQQEFLTKIAVANMVHSTNLVKHATSFGTRHTVIAARPVRTSRETRYPDVMEIEAEGPRSREIIEAYPGRVGGIRRDSPDVYRVLTRIPGESKGEMLRDYQDDSRRFGGLMGMLLGGGGGLGAAHLLTKRVEGLSPVRVGIATGLGGAALGWGLGRLIGGRIKPAVLGPKDLEYYGIVD